jgi:hypothetical protein
MLLLIFEYTLKLISITVVVRLPPLLQTQKYIPPSILTLHCLIQQSHTYTLDPRNTADNKYHVVTVRGFTSDGYAK